MGLLCLAVLGAFVVLLIQPLVSAEELTNPVVYTIQENYRATNPGPGDAAVTIYLLRNWSDWARQQVLAEILPSGQVPSTVDNKAIPISISPGTHTIAFTQTVMVYGYDLQLDPSVIGDSVQADFGHTSFVDGLWENKPELVAKARELTDSQPNFYCKAKAIFEFVRDNIQYEQTSPIYSAYETYQYRYGDCADKANLFIGLCRSVGIPAKFVSCYGYRPEYSSRLSDDASLGHAFAIVYFPEVGWAPVDLTWDSPEGLFGKLGSDHIIFATSDGNDMFSLKYLGELVSPDVARIWGPSGCSIEREGFSAVREVALKVETDSAANEIIDGKWKWFVRVKNIGARNVENLKVELQVDEAYFEPPSSEKIDRLETGSEQTFYFEIGVKDSVENATVKAIVTYDWAFPLEPYAPLNGTFEAKTERPDVNILLPTLPRGGIDLLLLVSIVAVIGVAIAVSITLFRR